jgi:hypothetical protein
METENQDLTSQLIHQSGIYTFVRHANEQRDESEIGVREIFAFTPEQSNGLENLFMPVFKEKLWDFATQEIEDMELDLEDETNRATIRSLIRIEYFRLYNIISPPNPDDPSDADSRPSNPIISIKKNALDRAFRNLILTHDLDSTVGSTPPSSLESSPISSPISLSSLSTESGPEYISPSSPSSSVETRRIRGGKTKTKRVSKTRSKKRTSKK